MEQLTFSSAFEVHEIEVIYKNPVSYLNRPIISESRDVAHVFRSSWDMNKIEYQEQFKVMLLNHAHTVLGIVEISSGGITGCVIDARLVFGAALKAASTRIILAHNHPSGSLKPSQADLAITDKLCQAGKLLDIQVIDHIILTKDLHFSFAEDGLIR